MTVHLPLEIISMIFKYLAKELLSGSNHLFKKEDVQQAFSLLLVSKAVRVILEPALYQKIREPGAKRIRVLCRTMHSRPELAAVVKAVDMEEGDPAWGDFDSDDDEDEDEEEESEEEEEEEGEGEDEDEVEDAKDGEERECEDDKDFKPQPRLDTPTDVTSETLQSTTETLKTKLEAEDNTYESIKQSCLGRLRKSNVYTRKWALLFQLPNLKSLALTIHSAPFANMGVFLHLPLLEDLDLKITVLTNETNYFQYAAISTEELLESIISSTKRLMSLTYEDGSGSSSFPVRHDAPRLKDILDNHAHTLRNLSIVLTNNDTKDWRMEQEFSDIEGYFGTMTNFTELRSLSIQLEVLLGRPEADSHLKDVLPRKLYSFTGLALPDYHGVEDCDRLWEEKDCQRQFEELAEVAEDGNTFGSLKSVYMEVGRKDFFNSLRGGIYEDGILGRSRIIFGWR